MGGELDHGAVGALLVAAAVTAVAIAFVRRSLHSHDREPSPVESISPVDRVYAIDAHRLRSGTARRRRSTASTSRFPPAA
jgi:hypothetical protein